MVRTLTAAMLLVSCDGGLDPMVTPSESVIGYETPLVPPPDSPPDTHSPPSVEDCYANFTHMVNLLTDVTGTDFFDPDDHTLVIYQERDEGNNGTIDITVTFEYDANGFLLAKTTDEEGHGTLLESWVRDDLGNDLAYVEDQGADGLPERTVAKTYDAYGGLTSVQEDEEGDGVIDFALSWTRDATGEALTQDVDSNGDGVTDFAWVFTLDGVNRQILGLGDREADGYTDITATTTYTDPVLEIGTTSMDGKGVGSTDEILAFERDALGRSLWEATDEGADGTFEIETFTTWDPTLDVPPLSVDTTYTNTPDGPVHQTFTSTYDALGRRTSFHDDLDINGTVTDALSTWTFQGACP